MNNKNGGKKVFGTLSFIVGVLMIVVGIVSLDKVLIRLLALKGAPDGIVWSSFLVFILLQSSSSFACKTRRYIQRRMIDFF